MSSETIWIRCRFMKRGVHYYAAAAENPSLATGDEFDVSYLAKPHAHDFWFDVQVQVTHDDRDIEFIQFRQKLEAAYDKGVLQCGHRSCEMLARELISHIRKEYGVQGEVIVGVYEDSLLANGGIVRQSAIS